MSVTAKKLTKMRAVAQAAGAREIAAAPSRRPPDLNRFRKGQQQSAQTVAQELKRIVDLPIRYVPSEDEVGALSSFYFQREAYNKGYRLYPSQAESLLAYSEVGGAFLPLAVGGGKTLTSLLIANDAYKAGIDKIMIIVPPALAAQLCDVDIKRWRPLTIYNTPVHRLAGLPKQKRTLLAKSGRKGLYIFTYSMLSRDHEILDMVKPGLIICDEAHSVTRKCARTRRFLAHLHEHKPQLVALSGTMTQKQLMDYFELARGALGVNSFLPNTATLTEEWSKLIDSSATSMSDFRNDRIPNAGPLKYVLLWARRNFPGERFPDSVAGFREAYQKRLTTCPGVVCSSGHDLPYSLYIKNDPVDNPEQYEGWDRLKFLVHQLENEWLTPNGDEIEEAMHLFRWKYWIEGAGFYSERYWPDIEWMMERGKYTSAKHAEDVLDKSQQYHANHMNYMRDLRAWIKDRARTGLDTPMLIGNEMHRNGAEKVGEALYASWKAWKDSDFEGRIERNKRAVRVCGFKIEKGVQWAKDLPKSEGGIIWYDNAEMGEWVCERLQEEGVDYWHGKAGKKYNEVLNDRQFCKGKVLVLSINAHFQGKNLQFDRNQFYLQWPRSAKTAEQAIGRQHRGELEYDEVYVTTCLTTEFDKVLFGATLNDAAYVHQSVGNKQKVIYATYSPKPEIIPFEVLVEMGADPKLLSREGREVLERTFND